MANLFVNLPAPASNGVGAGQPTASMGQEKTITVEGAFAGVVTIEIALDAGVTWGQVASFSQPGKLVLDFAAQQMRVRRTGAGGTDVVPGLPNVDIAADDSGAQFTALTVPAGDGAGASSIVSTFGEFNTINVTGSFTGVVVIQISEDGTDWADVMAFTTPSLESKEFTASLMRVVRRGTDPTLPGLPVVTVGATNDPNITSGASGGSLIFRPGSGLSGPTVFDTWTALYARLLAMRAASNGAGVYTIYFDNALGSPTIPAGGPYDMTNVTWSGFFDSPSSTVALANGATLTALRHITGVLTVANLNTVTPADVSLADFDIIVIDNFSSVDSSGGQPLWRTTTPGDVFFFVRNDSALVRNVIDLSVAGMELSLYTRDGSNWQTDSVTGIAGTTLSNLFISLMQLPSSIPGFLGTHALSPVQSPCLQPNPYQAAATTTGITIGPPRWQRFNASGGVIAATLPAVATAPASVRRAGCLWAISEESGTGGLTIAPSAGDTIEGQVGAHPIPGGGGILLVNDGVSNWLILGRFGDGKWNVSSAIAVAVVTARFGDVQRCDPTGGAFTVNLPLISAANRGQAIKIKNVSASANVITIDPSGAQTIDGVATVTIAAAQGFREIVSNGVSEWMITGS
jgi:hypothetical protein